jgi:hypothetical protein
MSKETTFNEDFKFLCDNIDKYGEVLQSKESMLGALGEVIKGVIANHYITKRLINNIENRKKMIKLLIIKYDKEYILNILENLGISNEA